MVQKNGIFDWIIMWESTEYWLVISFMNFQPIFALSVIMKFLRPSPQLSCVVRGYPQIFN
jgi:hypothetical protein